MALPDISKLSLDELTTLIEEANKLRAEKVNSRIAELEAEKAKLMAYTRGVKAPEATKQRGSVKITHRGPAGETWTDRGIPPNWGKKYGAVTKEDFEQFRIKE